MQSSVRTLFLSHEPGLLLSGCVLQGCAGPSEGDDIVQSDSLHVTSKPGGRLDAHALYPTESSPSSLPILTVHLESSAAPHRRSNICCPVGRCSSPPHLSASFAASRSPPHSP
ncbi:hypothetical protein IG631_10016 [Alternaria alternata]|nr:hypothetical protein IG631_10016 [Alternaria alternata]